MKKKLSFTLAIAFLGCAVASAQQSTRIDLQNMLAKKQLIISPAKKIQSVQLGDKKAIVCNGNTWLRSIGFSYGTIELDIRGRNEFLNSFPGIAFHAADTARDYEVIYFRPFNFRHADPLRRKWSLQYMSLPEYPYDRLRKDNAGQFENEILPGPKPEDWIHVRAVVQKDSIKVYVNGMDKPSLSVKSLGKRDSGMVGLWVDGTTADFANLVITSNK